jgi:hypothetical protein
VQQRLAADDPDEAASIADRYGLSLLPSEHDKQPKTPP